MYERNKSGRCFKRDIKMKEINCNLCEKKDEKELFWKNGYRIVQCKNCGLVYVNPQPEEEEIKQYYNEQYKSKKYPSEKKIKSKTREARKIIKSLKRIIKRKNIKLLDVGCGFGYLVKSASEAGWDAYGIEVADWMVDFAKKEFKIKVDVRSFPGSGLREESYDIITMLEVVEHFPNPFRALKEAHILTKKEGFLMIRVPDIESFPAKKDKIDWRGFVLPDHLYFFSFETLKKICEKSGFIYYKTLLNPPWRDIIKVVFRKS